QQLRTRRNIQALKYLSGIPDRYFSFLMFFQDILGNQPAVESAVFYEYGVGIISSCNDTGNVKVLNIGFHGFRTVQRCRPEFIFIYFDAECLQEAVIRMITDHGKNMIVRYFEYFSVFFEDNTFVFYIFDVRSEVHIYLFMSDQRIKLWKNPWFHTF